MIRVFGAVLVAGCGIWFGSRQARLLERRVCVLEEFGVVLEQMRRELELRRTPLAQLFRVLSNQTRASVKGLFSACAAELEEDDQDALCRIWTSQVEKLPELNGEERRILPSLGHVLGRYPGHEQGEAIFQVCQALELQTQAARQESRRLGRVYRALGAAGGGFLIILLL